MTERGKLQHPYPAMQSAPGIDIHQEISTVRCWTDPVKHDQLPLSISPPLMSESPKPDRVQKQIKNQPFAMTSAELIGNYWNTQEKPNGIKQPEIVMEATPVINCRRLSTEEVMRAAGMRFIEMHDQRERCFSALSYPSSQSPSGLSEGDLKEVELAQLLLAAADKVGEQKFDSASRLLSYCEMLSSKRASPVQRVVLSFANALRERIDKATGWHEVDRLIASTEPCLPTNVKLLECHTLLPYIQITQFAAIQAVVDNTATARRIHVIDLALRGGIHLSVLMQALSERKTRAVELLKVTAVVTSERDKVEELGRTLVEVAESMGLNFSFNVIFINDINVVSADLFHIDDRDVVAVYASLALMKMISRQDSLDGLLTRVIRNLNPSVMVVTEIEANLNAPSFATRFIEALFFYSTLFDCLDTCVAEERENKMLMEQHLCNGIKNILSTDGHERTTRNVPIDVWRGFFAGHGMVEVGLSESALYQAGLVAAQHLYGSFSMLEHDGKCLVVGWKGTPILSLSVWKFR